MTVDAAPSSLSAKESFNLTLSTMQLSIMLNRASQFGTDEALSFELLHLFRNAGKVEGGNLVSKGLIQVVPFHAEHLLQTHQLVVGVVPSRRIQNASQNPWYSEVACSMATVLSDNEITSLTQPSLRNQPVLYRNSQLLDQGELFQDVPHGRVVPVHEHEKHISRVRLLSLNWLHMLSRRTLVFARWSFLG